MALKTIKNKIVSTKKTGKVTKAMEAVSAVKMRKSQERALKSRTYAHTAVRILANLTRLHAPSLDEYMEERGAGRTLLLIITSDKGLAGSVNSAVLKRAAEFLTDESVDAIAVGRKAVEFYRREGRGELLGEYTNVADTVGLADTAEMVKTIFERWNEGDYKDVHIIYQNFISTFEQQPTARKLLPLTSEALHDMVLGIRPAKGVFTEVPKEERELSGVAQDVYTVEPSAETVIESLIPQLLGVMIFHALIETKASEHSARMVAMKNATDKAKEMTHALTLLFNKERQAAITAEVSEITGGIEALKT